MSKDNLREEIQHHRDIKNNLWTALILTIGGTISLFLNLNSVIAFVLAFMGIILSSIFLIGYSNQFDILQNLIKKYKQGE